MPPKEDRSPETSSSASERSPHSRKSSSASARLHEHAPAVPSQLREVYVPSETSNSPEDTMHPHWRRDDEPEASSSTHHHDLEFSTDGIQPAPDHASVHSNEENASPEHLGGILEIDLEPTVRSRLLNQQNWDAGSGCGSENCNHGTMSPRPWSARSYGTMSSGTSRAGFGGRYPGGMGPTGESADATHALLGDTFADGVMGGGNGQKKSTTKYLAERHGIRNQRLM